MRQNGGKARADVSEEDEDMTTTLRARSEIPLEDTWDVASVFPSDADWAAELARVQDLLPEVESFRGRLGQGPEVLTEFLAASESVARALDRIAVYATMRSATDATDETATALHEQGSSLGAQVRAALAFSEPELLQIGVPT